MFQQASLLNRLKRNASRRNNSTPESEAKEGGSSPTLSFSKHEKDLRVKHPTLPQHKDIKRPKDVPRKMLGHAGYSKDHRTDFWNICACGDVQGLKRLLETGHDPRARKAGTTPHSTGLHVACIKGYVGSPLLFCIDRNMVVHATKSPSTFL